MNELVGDNLSKSWLEIFGFRPDGQAHQRQVAEASDDSDLEWWFFLRAREFLQIYDPRPLDRP